MFANIAFPSMPHMHQDIIIHEQSITNSHSPHVVCQDICEPAINNYSGNCRSSYEEHMNKVRPKAIPIIKMLDHTKKLQVTSCLSDHSTTLTAY